MRRRVCKDCLEEGLLATRDARYPGPRCATHHRLHKQRVSLRSHALRTAATYSITGDRYWEIYEVQNRACAICTRATGKGRRRLAVDHDHRCCSGKTSCGECVRGLLCGRCNDMLAHVRDDVPTLVRAIEYLKDPPAQRTSDA